MISGNKKVEVVVLGTGSIGKQHAAMLKGLGYEPVLVSVRETQREKLRAEGWSVAASLEDGLAQRAEMCVIATETQRHVDDSIRATRAGFRVLVEKPLGVSSSDIERLASELAVNDLANLRVVCPLRWYEGIAALSHLKEKLGRIHSVNICCQSYLPDWRPNRDYKESYSASIEQGGVVRDLVHEIDYCNFLFGLPSVEKLQFVGSDGSHIGVPATSNALLSWSAEDGCLMSVQLDYLTRAARRSISVFGENGEIFVDLLGGVLTCELAEGEKIEQKVESDRNVAMQKMLKSFLEGEDSGCTYYEALQVSQIVDHCERVMHDKPMKDPIPLGGK